MPRDETLIVGRLQAHGSAPYQFQAGATFSLKLATDRGERVVWGKDLRKLCTSA